MVVANGNLNSSAGVMLGYLTEYKMYCHATLHSKHETRLAQHTDPRAVIVAIIWGYNFYEVTCFTPSINIAVDQSYVEILLHLILLTANQKLIILV